MNKQNFPIKMTLRQPISAEQAKSMLEEFASHTLTIDDEPLAFTHDGATLINANGDEVFFAFGDQDENGNFTSFTLYHNNMNYSLFENLQDTVLSINNQLTLFDAVDFAKLADRDHAMRYVSAYLNAYEKKYGREGFDENISAEEQDYIDAIAGLYDPHADMNKEYDGHGEPTSLWAKSVYQLKISAAYHENLFRSIDYITANQILKNLFPDMTDDIQHISLTYSRLYDINTFFVKHTIGTNADELALSHDIRDVFRENANDMPTSAYREYNSILDIINQDGDQLDSPLLKDALDNLLEETPEEIRPAMEDALKPKF